MRRLVLETRYFLVEVQRSNPTLQNDKVVMRLQLRCEFLLVDTHPLAKICYLNIWLRIRCGISIAHKSYVCCRDGIREGRSTLFKNTILRARIGETGHFCSSYRNCYPNCCIVWGSAPFRANASALCRFSAICSVGSRATRTRTTAIGAKTIGPWDLASIFFSLNLLISR